ncbi:MAG: YihY/virulence factor BrkB family protein [Dehalococcoidales bacterium]|nr:YihY/virulence factor BrkB family protein [Dehalococcoidales bacterium]
MRTGYIRQKIRSIIQELKEKPAVSLVVRVAQGLGEDEAGDMAGSIAYFAILSVFPLLLGIIALLGFFLPSEAVQMQIFRFFEQYIPGSDQVIERNIRGIIELRGSLGLFSVIGLFWTASGIFGAIGRVVNKAWNIRTYRPFYVRKLRDIGVAMGTSIVFFLSMASTVFSSVIPAIDLPVLDSLTLIVSRLVAFILIFITMLLLYKFIPNTKTYWRDVWPGALLAAILFEIARTAFTIYLNNFASYDVIYGSVATVIILLVWIYLSAFIVIIGAEFAFEYGRMRRGRGHRSPVRVRLKDG